MDEILFERLVLVFVEWFRCKRLFTTGWRTIQTAGWNSVNSLSTPLKQGDCFNKVPLNAGFYCIYTAF